MRVTYSNSEAASTRFSFVLVSTLLNFSSTLCQIFTFDEQSPWANTRSRARARACVMTAKFVLITETFHFKFLWRVCCECQWLNQLEVFPQALNCFHENRSEISMQNFRVTTQRRFLHSGSRFNKTLNANKNKSKPHAIYKTDLTRLKNRFAASDSLCVCTYFL